MYETTNFNTIVMTFSIQMGREILCIYLVNLIMSNGFAEIFCFKEKEVFSPPFKNPSDFQKKEIIYLKQNKKIMKIKNWNYKKWIIKVVLFIVLYFGLKELCQKAKKSIIS